MTEYQDAVKIVDTYMEAMSSKDYDTVVNLYAEDARLEDPAGSEITLGKQAISAFYHGIPDAGKLTCKRTGSVRYVNQEIMFPFECLMEIPDGGTMKIEIIDHFVLNDDGLIISMRAFWSQDTVQMLP